MTGGRHLARQTALQVLYFWHVGGVTPDQAIGAYFREHASDLSATAREFTERLVRGTAAEADAIDRIIEAHLTHWRLDRVAVIDRLILRLATWELRHERETPAAVVIDEAVMLARTFATDESVRFVNGVLDAIRRTLEQEGHVERG
jgi:N utilization substance protein B